MHCVKQEHHAEYVEWPKSIVYAADNHPDFRRMGRTGCHSAARRNFSCIFGRRSRMTTICTSLSCRVQYTGNPVYCTRAHSDTRSYAMAFYIPCRQQWESLILGESAFRFRIKIQNLNALLVRFAQISCNLLTAAEHLFGYFSQAKIPSKIHEYRMLYCFIQINVYALIFWSTIKDIY